MPTPLDNATRALGWRWSEAWSSWLCPVSHLISDMQVRNMSVSVTGIVCPLCHAEAVDGVSQHQREERRQAVERERQIQRAAARAVQRDTTPMPSWAEAIRDDPFGDKRRRTRVRTPEPEPTLVRKGRRYDLDEE